MVQISEAVSSKQKLLQERSVLKIRNGNAGNQIFCIVPSLNIYINYPRHSAFKHWPDWVTK